MAVTIRPGELWGMAIYEFRAQGNLVGRWNNNLIPGTWAINFEIARKLRNPNDLLGLYSVSWIEENGDAIQGTLEILLVRDAETEWIWTENTTIIFRGTGLRIGPNEIAVIYWQDIPPTMNNP